MSDFGAAGRASRSTRNTLSMPDRAGTMKRRAIRRLLKDHCPLRPHPALVTSWCGIAVAVLMLVGCSRSLREIDREVDRLLGEASRSLGDEAPPPANTGPATPRRRAGVPADATAESLETYNPPADELRFIEAEDDTRRVLDRLTDYSAVKAEPLELDLRASLSYAFNHSRDYLFAEEEYTLDVLDLIRERHLWGPRFFDDVTAEITGSGDDGSFDTALRVINDLRVTQRLPYGGEVSARALATVTENIHDAVAGENTQSIDLIFDANVPLLRGSGTAARESRIQAERDVIYAAREFERFRREFVFDISEEFLNLVVLKQGIGNAEDQVRSLLRLTEEQLSRKDEGLTDVINAGLAEQRYLQALDSLNDQQERYRLALERFKVTLGMEPDIPIEIVESTLGLPVPRVDLSEAVRHAMVNRLDLQTRRDQLNDAVRAIDVAKNNLLPDLDLIGSITIPTDDDIDRGGIQFEPSSTDFLAGVRFSLPLDREIERVDVRRVQIAYERAVRSYDEFVDNLAVSVRSAARDIDRAQFSLAIQAKGIRNAQERLEATELDETATARDRSDAADDLNQAKNDFDSAFRDLQLAVLRYVLETGQLRVGRDGELIPLDGMTIDPLATPGRESIVDGDADIFDLIEGIKDIRRDDPGEGIPEEENQLPDGSLPGN